jgi:hypothetical protein
LRFDSGNGATEWGDCIVASSFIIHIRCRSFLGPFDQTGGGQASQGTVESSGFQAESAVNPRLGLLDDRPSVRIATGENQQYLELDRA